MTKHVIIGNGVAGVSAAETIRELDRDASITLIAGEKLPPYSRPMISLVLDGSITPSRLNIRGGDFYEKLNIHPLIGHKAEEIDTVNRMVRTDRGEDIPFDRLLIATGADPRPIRAEGLELGNIFYMRTQEHVLGMVEGLDGVKEALVLGGGLVGFKAAHGLIKRGVRVTMLIRSGYPLSMQVDPEAGRLIQNELEARGLEVLVETQAAAFEGNGRVSRAVLDNGDRLDCQMVVIGKGVLPALSFVPRDKIEVDLGIRVDEHLMTGVEGVYAAGDVAEAVDVVRRVPWVNAIWPVAVEQGRLAGMNMAGYPARYEGSLGRNVIRVFGLDVLTGGLVNPPEDEGYRVLSQIDPVRKTYRKLVLQGDRLVGLVMVGRIEQGGVLLSLMQGRRALPLDPEALLSPHFNFGQIIP